MGVQSKQANMILFYLFSLWPIFFNSSVHARGLRNEFPFSDQDAYPKIFEASAEAFEGNTFQLRIFVPSAAPIESSPPTESSPPIPVDSQNEGYFPSSLPTSAPTSSQQPTYRVFPWDPSMDDDSSYMLPDEAYVPDNALVDSSILQTGAMFDVVAAYNLVIVSFDLHLVSSIEGLQVPSDTAEIEMYTRVGSIDNVERHPGAWTMFFISTIQPVPGVTGGALVDGFESINMNAGERRAFYFHTNSNAYQFSQSDSTLAGLVTSDVYVSDPRLAIMVGVGKSSLQTFRTSNRNQIWNGSIHYKCLDEMNPPSSSPSEPIFDENPLINSPNGYVLSASSYDGSSEVGGYMFELNNKGNSDVILSRLDIHTHLVGELPVNVYFRKGAYKNYERRPGAWSLILETSVLGMGKGKPTPLPKFASSITVQVGESISLYVASGDNTLSLLSTLSSSNDNGIIEDSNLLIVEGSGKGRSAFTSTMNNRIWNGALYYDVVESNVAEPNAGSSFENSVASISFGRAIISCATLLTSAILSIL